jgi:hypothetical protein
VLFPGGGESPTFPQVRLGCPSLWSAISSISALAGRVSGAGLCSLFSNFRFGGAETGSTADRDWFAECLSGIGRDAGAESTASEGSSCARRRAPGPIFQLSISALWPDRAAPFMAAKLGAVQGRAIMAAERRSGTESVRLGFSAWADASLVGMRQMSNV